MQKTYFFLSTVLTFLFSSLAFSQTTIFEDNFDTYTAGQQLACQNPVSWTTWSLAPCSTIEDAYVSNVHSYSGINSFVIVPSNDLVHLLGDVTTGKYKISFWIYIPAGKTGYFNTMSGFTGSTYEWAMWVNFLSGGIGQLDPFGDFSFSYDSWQHIELIVDLDNDMAEFYFEGVLVGIPWPWTIEGAALKLAAVDFWGPAESEMYVDDFKFELLSPTSVQLEDGTPVAFKLDQNYPNPFNPNTTIEFSVHISNEVELVIYDIFGQKIKTLEKDFYNRGTYQSSWDGTTEEGIKVSSGTYIYKLSAGTFTQSKKMILLK